ncbi:MAG: secretin and TonB N-terminal domain-containing protein [Candidatus Omnitrophota bacterium]|nr:MAG: secretin and TonB N-terminal domain-containing protein [Candidatus Omnitrophota bacterium]
MQRKTGWMKLPLMLLLGIFIFSFHDVALTQEIAGEEEVTDAGNITVDFKEADIHSVLKIISYKSGVNIVAGRDVSGAVTIRLVDVPWERALDVILKNNGFVYEREEDIIRVTTVENLSKEEVSTQVFILNYAKAEEVSEAIGEIISDRGKVKFDDRTNQVVVTDIPTNLYKISKVIEKLDKKTNQVVIEAKIIETVLDENEDLGIDWTLESAGSGSQRPMVVPFSTQKTYGKTGIEYFPRVDTTQSDFTDSLQQGFPFAVKDDFTFGTLDFTQLQFALEILKSRSDTKTLSNPRITTLNNQEAVIGVTETFNIPKYEVDSDTGRLVVSGYSEKDIGVKLTVTPHVNPEGYIVIDLSPEVSSFSGWDYFTTGTGTIQAPRFASRQSSTQVMVKDGQTIVIGGLIKEETVNYVKKVPILGDLPLLKYVFSKTEKDVDTTDLIIFVTVRLLDDSGVPELQELEEQAEMNVSRNTD